jgi:hypothetical protein
MELVKRLSLSLHRGSAGGTNKIPNIPRGILVTFIFSLHFLATMDTLLDLIKSGKISRASMLLRQNPDDPWTLSYEDTYAVLSEICHKNLPGLMALILARPGVNVSVSDRNGFTLLMQACVKNNPEMVRVLLASPRIDPNLTDRPLSMTALMYACSSMATMCAELLLQDPRVDITLTNMDMHTAIYFVIITGNSELLKWWIASGRKVLLGDGSQSDRDVIKESRGMLVIMDLVQGLQDHPEETRHRADRAAVGIFAPAVFLSDGLLSIKNTHLPIKSQAMAMRFFGIMLRLPMELQMMISHRAVGSMRDFIQGSVSERAFRDLAKGLRPSPPL